MAKYDVFSVDGGLVLDVQADILDHIDTRLVVPLVPKELSPKPSKRLNPVFTINGGEYVMFAQLVSALPVNILKQPKSNLSSHFAEITNALDMAFHGF